MKGHQQWRVRVKVPPHKPTAAIRDVTSNGRVGVRVLGRRSLTVVLHRSRKPGVASQW
ncbi:hypothetical protein HanIR_Chr05g0242291 [Helianthus annuus]|nr:hypothetical protein HanIR_Chr05g0242291 [Helianthus annuus]